MTLKSRILALKIASVALLILPGACVVLGFSSPLIGLWDMFLDLAYLPIDQGQAIASSTERMLTAIVGGVLVGFGVMIWQVADLVYRHDPGQGARILLPAILAWFVVDSLASVLSGGWFNAVLNLVFLMGLTAPILIPDRRPAEA